MANLFTVLASLATTMSTAGRNLVIAASAAAQRTALGSTAVGDAVFTAIDQAAGRTAIGAGTSSLTLGTTTGTAYDGGLGAAATTAASAAQTTANAALPKAGGTMTGDIGMSGTQRITNSLVPTAAGQGMVVPASVANGDIFAWSGGTLVRVASGGSNTFVGGDGTNVVSMSQTQAQISLGYLVLYSTASSSGWTTRAGSGGASITGGVARTSLPLSTVPGSWTNTPACYRPCTTDIFRCDVRARIAAWTGGNSSAVFASFGLRAASSVGEGAFINIRGDGSSSNLFCVTVSGGGDKGGTPVSYANLSSGNVWFRIVIAGGVLTAFYGIGAGTTQPTNWIALSNTTSVVSWTNANFLNVVVALDAIPTGSPNAVTVDWDSIQSSGPTP